MGTENESTHKRFCPHFYGSVGQDERTGRRLLPCCSAAASGEILYGYRRRMAEFFHTELCVLFEEMEQDKRWHFEMLGRLILVLGVAPVPAARLSPVAEPWERSRATWQQNLPRLLNVCVRQESVGIERLQTAMGGTDDRVVRSFLAQLIGDEERHIRALQRFLTKENNCC